MQDNANECILTPQEKKMTLQRNPMGIGRLSVEIAKSGMLLFN